MYPMHNLFNKRWPLRKLMRKSADISNKTAVNLLLLSFVVHCTPPVLQNQVKCPPGKGNWTTDHSQMNIVRSVGLT